MDFQASNFLQTSSPETLIPPDELPTIELEAAVKKETQTTTPIFDEFAKNPSVGVSLLKLNVDSLNAFLASNSGLSFEYVKKAPSLMPLYSTKEEMLSKGLSFGAAHGLVDIVNNTACELPHITPGWFNGFSKLFQTFPYLTPGKDRSFNHSTVLNMFGVLPAPGDYDKLKGTDTYLPVLFGGLFRAATFEKDTMDGLFYGKNLEKKEDKYEALYSLKEVPFTYTITAWQNKAERTKLMKEVDDFVVTVNPLVGKEVTEKMLEIAGWMFGDMKSGLLVCRTYRFDENGTALSIFEVRPITPLALKMLTVYGGSFGWHVPQDVVKSMNAGWKSAVVSTQLDKAIDPRIKKIAFGDKHPVGNICNVHAVYAPVPFNILLAGKNFEKIKRSLFLGHATHAITGEGNTIKELSASIPSWVDKLNKEVSNKAKGEKPAKNSKGEKHSRKSKPSK